MCSQPSCELQQDLLSLGSERMSQKEQDHLGEGCIVEGMCEACRERKASRARTEKVVPVENPSK